MRCVSGRNARGGRDMAVKERRKSVASTKGASWRGEERRGEERREKGGGGKVRVARERSEKHGGWKEGAIGEGRWNPEAEGGGFGRARIIFAEEKALPLFVVAEGTEVRIRGGWKIRGEQENDG